MSHPELFARPFQLNTIPPAQAFAQEENSFKTCRRQVLNEFSSRKLPPQAGIQRSDSKTPFCRYQEKEGRRITFFAKGKDCAVISLA